MPVYPKLRVLENSISGFNENHVRSKFKSRGAYWIENNDSIYKTYDGSYLDCKSSRMFSKEIVKEIYNQRVNE